MYGGLFNILMENQPKEITPQQFARIANNFYTEGNIPVAYDRIALDSQFLNYFADHQKDLQKKYRVALCFISINEPYWEFAKEAITGAQQFFLPGHDVEYFLWSDMPVPDTSLLEKQLEVIKTKEGGNAWADGYNDAVSDVKGEMDKFIKETKKVNGATVFPIEPIHWPMPTLMRFHTMLQQEELLATFDYVFYCDIDMRFVNVVGDEILGPGITAATHPMYHLDKKFWPPYEPNSASTAYIKRPGMLINEGDKKRFMPLYFAGGFQGGRSEKFIQAMKDMRKAIDEDLANNYAAIWNDESHWNKWLFDNPPEKVLSPSYIYPDSLIEEYYRPIWGIEYQPRLVTLTKKFSTSAEGGQAVSKLIDDMKGLK